MRQSCESLFQALVWQSTDFRCPKMRSGASSLLIALKFRRLKAGAYKQQHSKSVYVTSVG